MAGHDPPGPEPEVRASGWEGLKRTVKVVASKVKIASKPHVRLRVRKQVDLAVMQLTVGTDLGMSFENESGRALVNYMPNYTASLRDKYFWGDLGFDRKSASITYSKDFHLDTICVGVDLSYHVPSNCPYVNFNIHTTPVRSSNTHTAWLSSQRLLAFIMIRVYTGFVLLCERQWYLHRQAF